MVGRRVLVPTAALHALLACLTCPAAEPLAVAQLEAMQSIAAAEADLASAESELAAWRLAQLRTLQSRGHASWQEVSEQGVAVEAAIAEADASSRYLDVVLECQSRLAKVDLEATNRDVECVQLFSPDSPRMVACVPAERASRELLVRHLECLRLERDTRRNLDRAKHEAAIERARRVVAIEASVENSSHRLQQARLRLRLAEAKHAWVVARGEEAKVIGRRMARIHASLDRRTDLDQQSPTAFAVIGTRFVDATVDDQLGRLVEMMADEETVDIQRETRVGLRDEVTISSSTTIEDDWLLDASALRHWLTLQQMELRMAAQRVAMEARLAYLGERANARREITRSGSSSA